MVVAVRAEAILTAQNKLRPGLAQAAAELSRFRAMQTKAMAAFGSSAARAMSAVSQRSSAAMAAAQGRILAAGRSQLLTLGGPAALAGSYKQYADVDRQITRIGITANASAEELGGVRKQIEGIAWETAQSSGKVTGGLDVLVAQGRDLKDALSFLPSVARTAAATGSEVDDIAKSADAVGSNFKIAAKEMQSAFDIMAAGGNAGSFELKDQARYLPSIAPAAAAVGFSGTKGLTDLVALLQVIRKGSGSSEEAASSLNNIFQKMESEETSKRFDKFNVNLRQGLAKARKEGKNLVEVFADLTDQALKGDLSKLPQLFGDMEMARGMRALMTYRRELKALIDLIGKTSKGTVDQALARVTNDARAQIDHMFAAIENRAVQVGGALAKHIVIPAEAAIKRIEEGKNPAVNRMNEWSKHYTADVIAVQEIGGAPAGDYSADDRRLIDARKEFLTRQRIEEERERLQGEIDALAAKRKKIADETAAGNEILPPHLAGANNDRSSGETDQIDSQISATRTKLQELNALVAQVEEINLQLAEVQGAAAAAAKPRMTLPIGEVKTELEGLGQAGQTAGSQLADGFSLGMSRMENEAAAVISRVQQRLNSLRAPSLSFGSVSGLPTGKQGPE